MADITPVIETMEHRWMRAWVNGDMRAMKAITAKNFILLTGSKPPAILDRPSWIEAAANRHLASSYRFADIYVRQFGSVALFSATLELKATLDGHDRSGRTDRVARQPRALEEAVHGFRRHDQRVSAGSGQV